jgi:exodeoxyribonuclease I
MKTLYWHDYETWGEVPAVDRPSQFAGIRTDENLNIIGAPLVTYCKPSDDVLPKPEACMITGITPQLALKEGLAEPDFFAAIHAELSQPGTCGVGYNTLRFDDEVTRYGFYRNFFDPYEREWRNGNSRWDIIDMVRLTRALRPDGIEWPLHEDGKPSFKLEHLTAANGLEHADAHDALSDVYATIDVAKLIKKHQPALYEYVYQLRNKQKVLQKINLLQRQPLLHISSMFPAERGCAALVVPLAMHPVNKNGIICFDLSVDPQPLLDLTAEQIAERVFTRAADLPEGVERLPLKVVHANKCPVLVPLAMVDAAAEQRLQLDRGLCERHWQQLLGQPLEQKLQQVFSSHEFEGSSDHEQQLYGGFIGGKDKSTCEQVRLASGDLLARQTFTFEDVRLNTLLFRYRARNYPETLSPQEQQQWQEWRQGRLTDPDYGAGITLPEYQQRVTELLVSCEEESKRELLHCLLQYGDELLDSLRA